MRIGEVTEPKLTLYVDLDGVLCDLQEFLVRTLGRGFTDTDQDHSLWEQFAQLQRSGTPTFSVLKKMPDADVLWQWVRPLRPHILTATGGNHELSAREKTHWVQQNLTGYDRIITVPGSALKAQYATPHSVLIDDRSKSIDPWRAAGGIGIHHASAADTIDQLKNLGLRSPADRD